MIDDFASYVEQSGNFIAGRKTFELLRVNASRRDAAATDTIPRPEMVMLSTRSAAIPGVTVVRTPQDALSHLSTKGYQTALIADGARTHNAFLAERLVDELIFDIAPILESEGLNIVLPKDGFAEADLLACRELGSGVMQLHYAIRGNAAHVEAPTR